MIRGAGRLNKDLSRQDGAGRTIAARPDPQHGLKMAQINNLQESTFNGDHVAGWPNRPDAVTDGRQLFPQEPRLLQDVPNAPRWVDDFYFNPQLLTPAAIERVRQLLTDGVTTDGITIGMLARAVASDSVCGRLYVDGLRAQLDAVNPLVAYLKGDPASPGAGRAPRQ
jgi:hypothetical protein